MLPVGILMCIYMGWVAPRSFFRNEMTNGGTLKSHIFGIVAFIVKMGGSAADSDSAGQPVHLTCQNCEGREYHESTVLPSDR